MAVSMNTKLDRGLLIKILIAVGIPLLIMLYPLNETFTREIRLFLAITVWMLAWAAFEITDLLIPALLWPVLLVMFKVVPATVAYSSWLSMIVPSCLSGILLANILDEIGLLRRLTYWIVMKCGGSFNRTMYALFLACLVISIITFAGASTVIAGLCYGMCRALGIARKEEAAITMMVGMLGASTVRMFIYYPLSQGTILGSTAAVDPTFTFGFWELLKYNFPVLIYCFFCVWLMLRIGKTKNSEVNSGRAYFEAEYRKLDAMQLKEKKGAVILALMMLAILTTPLHGVDGMMVFVIAACVAYCPGVAIGSANNIRMLPLGTLIFLASCAAIGGVCSALGLTAALTGVFTPILSAFGTVGTLFAILTFGVVMNFCMTPLAMLAAFCGPVLQICNAMGMNPLAGIFVFNYATDMVFLPYEYVTFLIFFSFGMMTSGQFVKYQTIKNLLFYVFFGVIIIPFWFLVGLL